MLPRPAAVLCGLITLFASLPGAAAGPAASAPTTTHPASAWIEQAQAAIYRSPADAPRLAQRALEALVQQPDADLEVQARLVLCDHFAERDPDATQRELQTLDALLPRAVRPSLRSGVQACRGLVREYAGDTAQARRLYEEAVAIAETASDRDMLANALYLRGYLRSVQGELANALTDLRRAHALHLAAGQPERTVNTLNVIAIVYNRMGDHAQARDYFEQSLKSQQALGVVREQAVTLHNLGRAVENLGDDATARAHYDAALALSRQIDFTRGEAYALRGLASLANRSGDGRAAIGLIAQAESAAEASTDQRLRAQLLLQRGIAERLLKRPAESLAALRQALKIFVAADSRAELAQTYEALAATHADAGEWRAAFEREAEFRAESERLLRLQLDQRFATLKVEFDLAAKERENALLQREKQSTESALQAQQRAGRLQVVVIGLAAVLLAALLALAWKQRRAGEAMRSLALTDELTGLPNRRDALARLQAVLDRRGEPCSVLIADLDHFKRINDEHGHLVGDEVLKLVAQQLREAVSAPAFIGRLGGEEFVVVLPATPLDAASEVAERLRHVIARAGEELWQRMPALTVSVGVATSDPAGDSLSRMLRRADEALYDAKRAGRNRVIALAA